PTSKVTANLSFRPLPSS
ncbi:BnaUnng04990D, partial [Brassica napus]